MKIYLVTFGALTFEKTRWRLANQAKETGWFDNIFVYGEEDIKHFNKSIYGMRGAGYWWWKPCITLMALDQIENDSILLYLDAGCSLNIKGANRFYDYVNLCESSPGFVGFGGKPTEFAGDRHYTKRDVLKLLDCDYPKYLDTGQIGSGIYFVKKNDFGINLITEFKQLCNIQHMINDEPSFNEEYSDFIEHRHDQSVLSLLVKKRNLNDYLIDMIELNHTIDIELKYPIQATRLVDFKLD